ncbi:MAG: hypothetical protein HY084_13830 [Gemmatimonadetes bacterium]|nr:hypothetical protein [Gemmatimonadota bacterium]
MTRRALRAGSLALACGAASFAPRAHAQRATAARCARAADTVATSWVELDPPSGRGDVTARVCLRPAVNGPAVGSYHGELTWDPAVARTLEAVSARGGSRVVNASERGRVRFAGASPAGFASGELLRVRLRTVRRGRPARIALMWREVNAADGRSLLAGLRVDSVAPWPAIASACRPGELRLIGLSPDTVDLASGDRRPVVASGCGFAAGNTVSVGPATMRDVPSSANGTRLEFVVPLTLDATGEAPPMAMPPGRVLVHVTTPRGTSNALPLVLR